MVLAQTLPQRRTLTGPASSCAQCVPKFRAQHSRRDRPHEAGRAVSGEVTTRTGVGS